jgi:hypothetical protein
MERIKLWLPAAVLMIAGCASQAKFLDSRQPTAIDAALTRARFEMNCPDATATVLSREVVEPQVTGPQAMGYNRAVFTIGVAGCDKRSTVIVICQQGSSGCVAGNQSTSPESR